MRVTAARFTQSQYLNLALHGYHGGLNWLDVLQLAVETAHEECDSADLCGLLTALKARLEQEPEVLNTAQAVSETLAETVDIQSVLAAVEEMYPNQKSLSWRMTAPPRAEYQPGDGKVFVTVTMQHNKSVAQALADSILRYAVDSASHRAL